MLSFILNINFMIKNLIPYTIIAILFLVAWNQLPFNFQKFFPVTLTVCNESQYEISNIDWYNFNTYRIKKWECVVAHNNRLIQNRNTYDIYVHNWDNNTNEWNGIIIFSTNAWDNIWLKNYYFGNKTLTIKSLWKDEDSNLSSKIWWVESHFE